MFECPICLCPITNAAVGSCSHHFCHACLLEWCRQTPLCPKCRTPICEIRLDQEFEEVTKDPPSHPTLPHPTPPDPTIPHQTPPYPTRPHPTPPYPTPSHPTPTYPRSTTRCARRQVAEEVAGEVAEEVAQLDQPNQPAPQT